MNYVRFGVVKVLSGNVRMYVDLYGKSLLTDLDLVLSSGGLNETRDKVGLSPLAFKSIFSDPSINVSATSIYKDSGKIQWSILLPDFSSIRTVLSNPFSDGILFVLYSDSSTLPVFAKIKLSESGDVSIEKVVGLAELPNMWEYLSSGAYQNTKRYDYAVETHDGNILFVSFQFWIDWNGYDGYLKVAIPTALFDQDGNLISEYIPTSPDYSSDALSASDWITCSYYFSPAFLVTPSSTNIYLFGKAEITRHNTGSDTNYDNYFYMHLLGKYNTTISVSAVVDRSSSGYHDYGNDIDKYERYYGSMVSYNSDGSIIVVGDFSYHYWDGNATLGSHVVAYFYRWYIDSNGSVSYGSYSPSIDPGTQDTTSIAHIAIGNNRAWMWSYNTYWRDSTDKWHMRALVFKSHDGISSIDSWNWDNAAYITVDTYTTYHIPGGLFLYVRYRYPNTYSYVYRYYYLNHKTGNLSKTEKYIPGVSCASTSFVFEGKKITASYDGTYLYFGYPNSRIVVSGTYSIELPATPPILNLYPVTTERIPYEFKSYYQPLFTWDTASDFYEANKVVSCSLTDTSLNVQYGVTNTDGSLVSRLSFSGLYLGFMGKIENYQAGRIPK